MKMNVSKERISGLMTKAVFGAAKRYSRSIIQILKRRRRRKKVD